MAKNFTQSCQVNKSLHAQSGRPSAMYLCGNPVIQLTEQLLQISPVPNAHDAHTIMDTILAIPKIMHGMSTTNQAKNMLGHFMLQKIIDLCSVMAHFCKRSIYVYTHNTPNANTKLTTI